MDHKIEKALKNNQSVIVQFYFDAFGKIGQTKLLKSSGNKVTDLACTEAILAIAPMKKDLLISDKEHKSEFTFNIKNLKDYPKLEVEKPCVHYIPLSVLIHYPGKFHQADLTKKDNLRFFNKTDKDRRNGQVYRLEKIYDDWAVFFNEHRKYNKKAIGAKVKVLTNKKLSNSLKTTQ